MNDSEKRVLRRKNHTVAACYPFTPDRMKELQKAKLLTPPMLNQIEHEADDFSKMSKFLELFVPKAGPSGFRDLCSLLGNAFPLLADELKAELKVEHGTLKVDADVRQEAHILVVREYGHLMRLREDDRKKFEDLIAMRTQCSKEIWRRQLEVVTQGLRTQEGINAQKEERIRVMVEKLQLFRKTLCGNLPGCQDDKKGAATNGDDNDDDVSKLIEDQLAREVNEVQINSLEGLMELERLMAEKTNSIQILELDNDATSKLDSDVSSALEQLAQKMNKTKTEATEQGKKAHQLSNEMSLLKLGIDQQVARDEDICDKMRRRLRDYRREIRESHEHIGRLRRQADATRNNLIKYKLKVRLLEKNRNIGYVYEKGLTRPDDELPQSWLVEATTKRQSARTRSARVGRKADNK